jgi:hypothetical protein
LHACFRTFEVRVAAIGSDGDAGFALLEGNVRYTPPNGANREASAELRGNLFWKLSEDGRSEVWLYLNWLDMLGSLGVSEVRNFVRD